MDIIPGLNKLLDIAASGIGAVAGPFLAPWKARREGQASIITAETDARVSEIRAEAHVRARKLIVGDGSVTSGEIRLSDRVNERLVYQEQKRLANIEAVMGKAALEVEDKKVPDTELDHDWAARFFNDVQDVSSDEMQVLWAKVLAGEVERSGSTSIRTLGILRNLDRETAQLFAKFCSACIFFAPEAGCDMLDARVSALGGKAASNSLESFGFDFAALNRLNEHGLITSDYDSWFHFKFNALQGIPATQNLMIPFHHQSRQWWFVTESNWTPGKEFKIEGPALSLSGRELSMIVKQEPLHQYTEQLRAFFLAKGFRMQCQEEPIQ